MSFDFLTPFVWAFLPSYLTKQLLPFLAATFPAYFPPAPAGSPQYAQNYRYTFTLIVGGYLLWSFINSGGLRPAADWYDLLGVQRTASEEQLKRAFRNLSRTYHPDRAGVQNEGQFILIRQAYETLLDPVKRYAYDRFGSDTLSWKGCSTVKEYMYAGILRSSSFYVFSGAAMLLLSVFGGGAHSTYWSKTLFSSLLIIELYLILSPTRASDHAISSIVRILSRPQFAQVEVIHRLWASLSVALNQLASVWSHQGVSDEVAWQHLGRMTHELEAETVAQFQADLVSVLAKSTSPLQVQTALQQNIEQILVDRTVSSHPAVKDLWRQAALAATPSHARPEPRPLNDLEIAQRIPLPPSPPMSPIRSPQAPDR